MKHKLLAIVFVLLMVSAGYLQYTYDSHHDYFARRLTFVTLPSGKTIKILSFGFHNLAADMLFIWSIQFYCNYHLTNMYDYLEHVYNVITDINPHYMEPYIVGSWIMALEAGDIEMAIRLLQKGAKQFPDEWIFDYECGFYAYKNLKDFKRAEEYFDRAAAKTSAPSHVRRKKAHMAYLTDNLEYAYNLWKEIYEKADSLLERDSAVNHLFQIKFEMDRKWLEQRINTFKRLYGRYPHDLAELKPARLAAEIPVDFFGSRYVYDPGTGKISAQKVFRWKKWQ
jgi:tetratricopeptide (TPR) repeat protein